MRETVTIEVREGDKKIHFYANGKWIQGCRKCYLLDLLYELTVRYENDYPCEVVFKMGGYEPDERNINKANF